MNPHTVLPTLKKRKKRSFDEHYDNLSPEQISSIYMLTKIGYTLLFVRVDNKKKTTLAILDLQSENKTCEVDSDGMINDDIELIFREVN